MKCSVANTMLPFSVKLIVSFICLIEDNGACFDYTYVMYILLAHILSALYKGIKVPSPAPEMGPYARAVGSRILEG